MRPETALKLREDALDYAVNAMKAKVPVRKAALANLVPPSTAHDRLQAIRRANRRTRKRSALTDAEEQHVVSFALRWADMGVPLTRLHLIEATAMFIEHKPFSRRRNLPFTDGKPGYKWARGFFSRHKEALKLAYPSMQEEKSFAAVNAETLTTHFASLRALTDEYKLDAERARNLDETGVTPGRDAKGRVRTFRVVRRGGTSDVRVPVFSYTNHVTIMPCVSAGGAQGPSLWVFKGTRLPCREISVGNTRVTETLSSFLPGDALPTMEPDTPVVNGESFYEWALKFTASIRHLVAGGRKVLLTYDAYRSHMTLRVLEHLRANGVVVYALPAHTSGKTQPCDTGIFWAFKRDVNKAISEVAMDVHGATIDIYELTSLLLYAYRRSLTTRTITSTFRAAGVWPVDPAQLISTPRPRDISDFSTLLDAREMGEMFMAKLTDARQRIFGANNFELRRGFVDITRGLVLTSDAALEAARTQTAKWQEKQVEATAKAANKAANKKT